MGRTIDADVLIEDIRNRSYIDKGLCEIFETIIDEQPTSVDTEKIEKILTDLEKAKFPITDLKQGIMINGSQQTDDAVLYSRAVDIVRENTEINKLNNLENEQENEECKDCRRWTCLECSYADI